MQALHRRMHTHRSIVLHQLTGGTTAACTAIVISQPLACTACTPIHCITEPSCLCQGENCGCTRDRIAALNGLTLDSDPDSVNIQGSNSENGAYQLQSGNPHGFISAPACHASACMS